MNLTKSYSIGLGGYSLVVIKLVAAPFHQWVGVITHPKLLIINDPTSLWSVGVPTRGSKGYS